MAKGFFLLCLLWTSISLAEEQDLSSTSHCPTLPYEEGRLFEVTKQGKPASFVFGTIQVVDPEITAIPETIKEAISRVEYVATEIRIRSGFFGLRGNIKRPPMQGDLFSIIGSEREKKIKEIAEEDELFIKFIQMMRPWEVAFILEAVKNAPDFDETKSVSSSHRLYLDGTIAKEGWTQKKKYRGLETPSDKFAHFDQMPLQLQLEMLDEVLEPEDNDEVDYHESIKAAYLSGKTGVLHCELANSQKVTREMNTYMLENVLNKRNHKMHEKIKKLFDRGAFVAVGAAHLPGEEGILNLLNKDGYEVKRLAISNRQN